MFGLLRRYYPLVLSLGVIAFLIWACSTPSQVAFVETAAGFRIEIRSAVPERASDPGTGYHVSAVLEARDGRRSGPIEIDVDPENDRTNLYRTTEGCLVFVTRLDEVAIVEATLAVAERGACSWGRIPRNDCPDPAFDPATRTARPLSDSTGYLGTFAVNRGEDQRLLVWQFHHAVDEPECLFVYRGG